MKTNLLLIICMLFLGNTISIAYNIIYVDVNGPNDPGTGAKQDPYRRIQAALNAAVDTDVIEIRPGVYTGIGNYNLDLQGKTLVIRSTDPNNPDITAKTIVDPNKAGRGFYLDTNEEANCVISGLTIRNAHTGGKGGGIISYYNKLCIKNCIISDNFAGTHGGAIFSQNSNVQITGCIIRNNSSANDGGGIEHWEGQSFVKNCIITNNNANGAGGGADFFNSNDVTLTNCTFSGNAANSGGALYCWGSNIAVNNSILWANTADIGPEIALNISASGFLIEYSDIQAGEAAASDPGRGLNWGIGNIDTDPCFASFDLNGDPDLWDMHLQSAYGRFDPNSNSWVNDVNTSPCIDAGDPNSYWQKETWPNGKRINMGVYGGIPQASKNGNIADFDINGSVDFGDYGSLAGKWHQSPGCIEDVDNNGEVDLGDIVIFQKNWLWQR